MDFGNRVTVCDSRFASRGAGLQVELAAKMAREGHTVEEILPALQDLRERTLARLQLESLEYIRARWAARPRFCLPLIGWRVR